MNFFHMRRRRVMIGELITLHNSLTLQQKHDIHEERARGDVISSPFFTSVRPDRSDRRPLSVAASKQQPKEIKLPEKLVKNTRLLLNSL
jgi:hypothetical protein